MEVSAKRWIDIFAELALSSGFQRIGRGWGAESSDTIVVLDLQKSKYGTNYYCNINVFLHGLGGTPRGLSATLVGKVGDIVRRHPPSWEFLFDPVKMQNIEEVRVQMGSFFKEFVVPFLRNMETKQSIIEFAEKHPGEVFLLPAVKGFLGIN